MMEAAALTLLGTLAGAIVGALGTLAVERSRREYEDRTRWHADRRQLYARVLREADAARNFAQRHVIEQLAVATGAMEPAAVHGGPDLNGYLQSSNELSLLLSTKSRGVLLLLDSALLYLALGAEIASPPKVEGVETPAYGNADRDFATARQMLFHRAQLDLGIPQRKAGFLRRLRHFVRPRRPST